jgi:hypothetical protein
MDDDSPFGDGSALTLTIIKKLFAFSPKSTNVKADLNMISSLLRGLKYTSVGLKRRVVFSPLTGMKAALDRRSKDAADA